MIALTAGFGVHLAAGDFNNMIHFYKNLVMAGGFLYVMTYGSGAMSISGGGFGLLAVLAQPVEVTDVNGDHLKR